MSDAIPDLWPEPKRVVALGGRLALGVASGSPHPRAVIDTESGSFAAEALAARLCPIASAPGASLPVRLTVDPRAAFAASLGRDARPEAYRLDIRPGGIGIVAAETEGLLRGAATLLQLATDEGDHLSFPCLTLTDWPDFRFRCAADWLLNAEINRWGYDWGDGVAAYLRRVKRKLDHCFASKINQVWFDGCGWDVTRFPGYAALQRELTGYARRRGIRLTFAGYGGGYGTSYQQSELYRCGYQGRVFRNQRPYPNGPEYDCCGFPGVPVSRRYGTCLANDALHADKLAEMAHFVVEVQPGFMYIHDIDTGAFAESREAWRVRCDECRRRWPSDEMAAPDGQAAAVADWYRKVREQLSLASKTADYDPARDLTLIFASPVYTHREEAGQPDVWTEELAYYRLLSRMIGPLTGIEIAIREQFLEPSGEPRVAQLRRVLDEVGHGHGLHVIAFGGGDMYNTDDLAAPVGAFAPYYRGAESVCLSNGGVHEEPVQLMNAEFLWSGACRGYAERRSTRDEVEAAFTEVSRGRYRPPELLGPEGALQAACRRLWGEDAGSAMYRAHTAGKDGARGPVSRIWWAVTREVRRLRGDPVHGGWTWEGLREHWAERLAATERALARVREAQDLCDDPDIAWFARCLEVGRRFAEAVLLAVELRLGEAPEARERLTAALDALEQHLRSSFPLQSVDLLGGDPGCWLETVRLLREAALNP